MTNLDDLLRHELYLSRLASGDVNAHVNPALEDTYKAIREILQKQERINTPKQLETVLARITRAVNSNGGWPAFTASMTGSAIYESEWQSKYMSDLFESEVKTVAPVVVEAQLGSSIMTLTSGQSVQSGIWGQFIAANLESRAKVVNNIVTAGYSRGETINQMSKSIRESFNGVIKREADTLARTGYIHYAAQANEAVIDANTDVLKEYYYVVTFDNRTSDVCIGVTKFNEQGKRFKVGDPKAPQPPLHYGCRTRRLGVPKGYTPEGYKAAVGGQSGTEAKEQFQKRDKRRRTASQVRYRGRKDGEIFKAGQIRGNTSYQSWLKSQPRWFINDTIGPKRAKLLMDGDLPLAKLSDSNGRPLTLAEIKSRDAEAFERAGL